MQKLRGRDAQGERGKNAHVAAPNYALTHKVGKDEDGVTTGTSNKLGGKIIMHSALGKKCKDGIFPCLKWLDCMQRRGICQDRSRRY